jgi:thioredoxin-related protein
MNKCFSIFLTFFIFSTSVISQESSVELADLQEDKEVYLNWELTYKNALKRAKKEKKPVMIYFTGSDWCTPCKVLDRQLFHTEKFKSFSDDNLILLEVDSPRRVDLLEQKKLSENLYLKKKYKVKSFPTLVFVNHRGKKVAEKRGYVLTEYYYPFIQSVVYKYKK